MTPITTITWASDNFDLVPIDERLWAEREHRYSIPLIVGNTVTGQIHEECLRWDYDNDCWVKAFEMSDSDVQPDPNVWAPWPTIV
jgi:hypothetical protein